MSSRQLLVFFIFLPCISFGQDVAIPWIIGDVKRIEPDQYYLAKNVASEARILRRVGGFNIVKGDEITSKEEAFRIHADWKLLNKSESIRKGKAHYYVTLYNADLVPKDVNVLKKIDQNSFLVECNAQDVFKKLLPNNNVVAVQLASRKPRVETGIRQHDLNVNSISLTHHKYPDLKGNGMYLSVKENAFDVLDFDITSRATLDEFSSSVIEMHATEMSTLIGGAGNTFSNGKGVANKVNFYSASFENLLPESNLYYQDRNVTVQNHSYGVQVENFYGLESEAYDVLSLSNPNLVHIFSIGNSGSSNGSGPYEGISGYGTITGSFKQAKNVMLISSSDSLGQISDLNSRGPAYDGRIKPDLVAFGGEGTSEAAALVSGSAILIQEKYQNKEGSLPTSDLVRSLLIAGADDYLEDGPDFISGYGQLNLFQSLQIIDSGGYFQDEIMQDENKPYSISIPQETAKATFVLVWNDFPANQGDSQSLVNDLNLSITKDGNEWLPWVLDATPDVSKLSVVAIRGIDSKNNVEVITIDNPIAGDYEVSVDGIAVVNSQSYSICYRFDEVDSFEWTYPTASDQITSGEVAKLRWSSTITEPGTVEIDYLDGNWIPISESISLGDPFVDFSMPEETTFAKVRMNTSSGIFESDTFLIASQPQLQVDFNCEEDLILNWTEVNGANYSIRKFLDGNLQEIAMVTDTFIVLNKLEHSESFYSVLPIVDELKSIPSFLINIDQQGVGCHISNFLVTPDFDLGVVQIEIRLAGTSLIDNISIQKSSLGSAFYESDRFEQPLTSIITIEDSEIESGITSYRVEVRTNEGSLVTSETRDIFYTDKETFVNFPNPITDGYFYFLSQETGGLLQILDSYGKVVASYDIVSESEFIELPDLSLGLYYYRVISEENIVSTGKLVKR